MKPILRRMQSAKSHYHDKVLSNHCGINVWYYSESQILAALCHPCRQCVRFRDWPHSTSLQVYHAAEFADMTASGGCASRFVICNHTPKGRGDGTIEILPNSSRPNRNTPSDSRQCIMLSGAPFVDHRRCHRRIFLLPV